MNRRQFLGGCLTGAMPIGSAAQSGSLGGGDTSATLQWTNWPVFTVGMVQCGYSDEEIQKILGGNMLRAARAALPQRT